MSGKHRKDQPERSSRLVQAAIAAISLSTVLMLGGLPTATAATQTDVIGVGGTGDSSGTKIFDKLNSYFKTPSTFVDQGLPYSAAYYPINQSVDAAVPTLDQQITDDQGNPTILLGYSQGTLVIVKWLKQQDGKPANPDIAAIFLLAAPNSPNGGIYARYPWLQGNPLAEAAGFDFNGAVPTDTPYQIAIINRQYDPYGDSPLDPLNPLADLNSLAAVEEVHPDANYDNINAVTVPPGSYVKTYTNSQGGTLTVVTVPNPNGQLPLTMPIQQVGDALGVGAFVKPVVDLVNPTLQTGIETGYDRSLPVDQGTPAQPGSSLTRLPAALAKIPGDIQQGATKAISDLGNIGPSSIKAPSITPLAPLVPTTVTNALPHVSTPSLGTPSSSSNPGNLFRPTTITGGSSSGLGANNPISGVLGAVHDTIGGITKAIGSIGKPASADSSAPSGGSTP